MRAFIRWLFFKNEDLKEFIKNDSNNENWPVPETFGKEVYQKWQDQIDNQQKEINLLEAKNNKTRQLMANIQRWFIEEHNLLSKPAKRAWLAQKGRVKRLEQELKIHQYNLDHPKQELEEYEKQCLLNKIRVWENKVGSAKADFEKAEEAYEIEKRELCQRLAYSKEDIPEPFLRNPEERIDLITRKLVINHEDYSKWWRIGIDIDPESKPLEELRKRIDEWYEHNEGKGPEHNPYEIWVDEKTDDSITFLWKPAEQELMGADGQGVKGKYLPLCKNYLFNYYGEWYEVADYDQVNYNSIVIVAQKSIFYNRYLYLIQSQVSGILHHSTSRLVAREEICSCPRYDIANVFYDFGSTYELKLNLYKLDKDLVKAGSHIEEDDLRMVVPLNISATTPIQEQGIMEEIWNGIWESSVGTVYFLLSQNLRSYALWRKNFVSEKWKEIKQESSGLRNNSPIGEEITDVLKKFDLLESEMFHFLRYHIKGTLYWRKKQIWQGNYWMIHNHFKIMESVNPSGTCISFFGTNNTILNRVTENITSKVGGNSFVNKFVECIIDTTLNDDKGQNNRQTERSVISESSVNGGEIKKRESKTKTTSSVKNLSQGNNKGVEIGSKLLQPHLYSVDHTKSEYTFYQFWHRYVLSGKYPLSLRIEFNQNLLNQYKRRRALKGPMTYDYYNSLTFGEMLNSPGYFKSSIVSMNMGSDENWFREKIEQGVNLWKEDSCELFKKELPGATNFASRGGNATGNFNVVSLITNKKQALGRDNLVHVDDMSWVWKDSYCRPENGGTDLFPQLINQGRSKIKQESGSAWKFDGYEKWSGKITLPKGIWFEWYMHAYSNGQGKDQQHFRDKDGNGYIIVSQDGADWSLKFFGNFEFKNTAGDPEGLPPSETIPEGGFTGIEIPSTPFNPNQFPQSGNLMPNPTGSGEVEIAMPDIDIGPDPDWDQGIDIDPTTDIDPTQDVDKPTDDDLPIDIDTVDDDDDND